MEMHLLYEFKLWKKLYIYTDMRNGHPKCICVSGSELMSLLDEIWWAAAEEEDCRPQEMSSPPHHSGSLHIYVYVALQVGK